MNSLLAMFKYRSWVIDMKDVFGSTVIELLLSSKDSSPTKLENRVPVKENTALREMKLKN